MAKKDKTVLVSIDEIDVDGETLEQVSVNKQVIGDIRPNDKKFLATTANGQKIVANSQEDALQAILAEFNLHG